jgi:hypothetical protein
MDTMITTVIEPEPESHPSTDQVRPGRLRTGLQRAAYAALALPLGLLSLGAALLGQPEPVNRWQRALAQRLLDVRLAPAPPPRRGEALRHSLLGLPVHVLAFALVGPAWGVFLARGVLYPVFGADHLENSWGGPSLAGAWLAHFIQGPPLLLLVDFTLRPLSRLQTRLARRR